MRTVFSNCLRAGLLIGQAVHAADVQNAVVLLRGNDNPAASAPLAFLKSDAARRVIRAHGYAF